MDSALCNTKGILAICPSNGTQEDEDKEEEELDLTNEALEMLDASVH